MAKKCLSSCWRQRERRWKIVNTTSSGRSFQVGAGNRETRVVRLLSGESRPEPLSSSCTENIWERSNRKLSVVYCSLRLGLSEMQLFNAIAERLAVHGAVSHSTVMWSWRRILNIHNLPCVLRCCELIGDVGSTWQISTLCRPRCCCSDYYRTGWATATVSAAIND